MNGKNLAAHISKGKRIDRGARVKPQTLAQVARPVRRRFYPRLEKLLHGRLIDRGKERGEHRHGGRVDIDFRTVAGEGGDDFVQAGTDGRRKALDPPELTQGEQRAVTRN